MSWAYFGTSFDTANLSISCVCVCIGAIPGGEHGGGWYPPNLEGWDIVACIPPKLSAPRRNVVPPPQLLTQNCATVCMYVCRCVVYSTIKNNFLIFQY